MRVRFDNLGYTHGMSNEIPILITAGATRNPIDAVRYISANSSGRTGVYLANAFRNKGCHVDLLGSPEACLRMDEGTHCVEYGSTYDLEQKIKNWVIQHPHGAVLHAAAVGDLSLIHI